MELKQITGKNRWCGPAVVSFITGLSTDDVSLLIRQQTGRKKVTGTYASEVRRALNACGYSLVRRPVRDKPTLAKWLRDNKDQRTAGRVYLIEAGNHWQLVTGRRYACGIVRDVVSVKHPKVKRRARVKGVYEVMGSIHADDMTQTIQNNLALTKAARREATNTRATARKKAKSLAAVWGVDIEVDDFGGGNLSIYCFPPQWFQDLRDDGEVDVEIVAYSWDEAVDVLTELNATMEEWHGQRAA